MKHIVKKWLCLKWCDRRCRDCRCEHCKNFETGDSDKEQKIKEKYRNWNGLPFNAETR